MAYGHEKMDPSKPPTPEMSVKTALMTTFFFIVFTAIALIVIGAVAYPAWELLQLGWSFLA